MIELNLCLVTPDEQGLKMERQMDNDPRAPTDGGLGGLKIWLRSPVTVTLPGWGVVAAGAAALLLVLVALD
jgi:hypothetical protein